MNQMRYDIILMLKGNFSTGGGRDNPELSLLLLGFLHINTKGVIQEVSKNKEVEKALTCHVNFEEKELSNYVLLKFFCL